MLRLGVLCLATTFLAQAIPGGCGPADTTDPLPAVRGTIETQASAMSAADAGETVTLSATASASADGGPVSYSWTQTGGPGVRLFDATSAVASFSSPSLDSPERLAFRVSTRNEQGDVGSALVEVTVRADPDYGSGNPSEGGNLGNRPPVARAGADQTGRAEDEITLDGSASTGRGLTYAWRQTAGETVELTDAQTARAGFTAPSLTSTDERELEFELTVRDAIQRVSRDRTQVTVAASTGGSSGGDGATKSVRVKVVTTFGAFTMELDGEKAPKTVENFMSYVDEKFYDGTIFHRVIPGFVVQGGGLLPGLTEKEPHDPVDSEASNGLKNVRGSVAMARTNDPDSATSQWYVNLVDNTNLDQATGRPGYTVFGKVIEGMDVVDLIAASPTTTQNGFSDVPVNEIFIESARRIITVGNPGGGGDGDDDERTP